jgi:hypothetical protein
MNISAQFSLAPESFRSHLPKQLGLQAGVSGAWFIFFLLNTEPFFLNYSPNHDHFYLTSRFLAIR